MTSDQAPPAPLPIVEDRHTAAQAFRLGLPASLVISLSIHAFALLASLGAPIAAKPSDKPPRLEATLVKPQAPPAPTPPADLRRSADTTPVDAVPATATTEADEPRDESPIAPPQLIGQPDFSE